MEVCETCADSTCSDYRRGGFKSCSTWVDPSEPKPTKGINLDDGKLRVDLVPFIVEEAIATILGESAQPKGKYPPRNWEKGMDWMRTYGSARRHELAWLGGEDIDPESGQPHIWHILCRYAFLAEYARTGKGKDDRPGKVGVDETAG